MTRERKTASWLHHMKSVNEPIKHIMVKNIAQDRIKAKINTHTKEYNPRNKELATDG